MRYGALVSLALALDASANPFVRRGLEKCKNLQATSNNGGRKIGIVVDESGSMYYSDPYGLRIDAAKAVNDWLISSGEAGGGKSADLVTVIGFDDTSRTLYPLGDPSGADKAIDQISVLGSTYIAGGVDAAISELTKPANDPTSNRTGIVVLTDGSDYDTLSLVQSIDNAGQLGIRVSFGFLAAYGSDYQDPDVLTAILGTGGMYATIDGATAQNAFVNLMIVHGLTDNDNPSSKNSTTVYNGLSVAFVLGSDGTSTLTYSAEAGESLTFQISSVAAGELEVTATDAGGKDLGSVNASAYSSSTPDELQVKAETGGNLKLTVKGEPDQVDALFIVGVNSSIPLVNCTLGDGGGNQGLSKGAKAGIGIGTVLAVGLVGAGSYFAFKYFKGMHAPNPNSAAPPPYHHQPPMDYKQPYIQSTSMPPTPGWAMPPPKLPHMPNNNPNNGQPQQPHQANQNVPHNPNSGQPDPNMHNPNNGQPQNFNNNAPHNPNSGQPYGPDSHNPNSGQPGNPNGGQPDHFNHNTPNNLNDGHNPHYDHPDPNQQPFQGDPSHPSQPSGDGPSNPNSGDPSNPQQSNPNGGDPSNPNTGDQQYPNHNTGGPDQMNPNQGGPDQMNPNQGGPDQTNPNSGGPDNHTTPNELGPDNHTTPNQLGPDNHTTPNQLGPDNHTTPNQMGPDSNPHQGDTQPGQDPNQPNNNDPNNPQQPDDHKPKRLRIPRLPFGRRKKKDDENQQQQQQQQQQNLPEWQQSQPQSQAPGQPQQQYQYAQNNQSVPQQHYQQYQYQQPYQYQAQPNATQQQGYFPPQPQPVYNAQIPYGSAQPQQQPMPYYNQAVSTQIQPAAPSPPQQYAFPAPPGQNAPQQFGPPQAYNQQPQAAELGAQRNVYNVSPIQQHPAPVQLPTSNVTSLQEQADVITPVNTGGYGSVTRRPVGSAQ